MFSYLWFLFIFQNTKPSKNLNICLLTSQGSNTKVEREIAKMIKDTDLQVVKVN